MIFRGSASLVLLILATGAFADVLPVTTGNALDYQVSIIRSTTDGARIAVFERLDGSVFGDLWLTRSTDGGTSWSAPAPIIATTANERHPALIQTGASSYSLFYLKGTGATTSYRLWRATSSDGEHFTEQAMLDLGWASGGEVNPHVVRHADGTLTMSYQRLSGGVYVAESSDAGINWDQLKTPINAIGQLPRISFRESDGVYLSSYQTGSTALQMFIKTSTDVHDWSAPAQDFAISGNNHDSLPVVMPDGAFVVFWIRESGGQFDIAARRSLDGLVWAPTISVTATASENDVEPHPLIGTSPGVVELYWGRESPVGSSDYDIVRDPAVIVLDSLFIGSFDP